MSTAVLIQPGFRGEFPGGSRFVLHVAPPDSVERRGVSERGVRAILRRRAAQAVPAHAGHRQRLGAQPAGGGEPRQLIATTRAQRQAIYPGRPAQRALRRQQVGEQGVDGFVNFSGHGWVDRTWLVAILASAAPCAS